MCVCPPLFFSRSVDRRWRASFLLERCNVPPPPPPPCKFAVKWKSCFSLRVRSIQLGASILPRSRLVSLSILLFHSGKQVKIDDTDDQPTKKAETSDTDESRSFFFSSSSSVSAKKERKKQEKHKVPKGWHRSGTCLGDQSDPTKSRQTECKHR